MVFFKNQKLHASIKDKVVLYKREQKPRMFYVYYISQYAMKGTISHTAAGDGLAMILVLPTGSIAMTRKGKLIQAIGVLEHLSGVPIDFMLRSHPQCS